MGCGDIPRVMRLGLESIFLIKPSLRAISGVKSVDYAGVGWGSVLFFPREHRKSVREQLRKSVREYLALVRELSRIMLPVNPKKWP